MSSIAATAISVFFLNDILIIWEKLGEIFSCLVSHKIISTYRFLIMMRIISQNKRWLWKKSHSYFFYIKFFRYKNMIIWR